MSKKKRTIKNGTIFLHKQNTSWYDPSLFPTSNFSFEGKKRADWSTDLKEIPLEVRTITSSLFLLPLKCLRPHISYTLLIVEHGHLLPSTVPVHHHTTRILPQPCLHVCNLEPRSNYAQGNVTRNVGMELGSAWRCQTFQLFYDY